MRFQRIRAIRSVVVLGGLVLSLTGCAALKQVGTYPKASVQGAEVQDVGLTALTLAFDIAVTNPYSVTLPVLGLDFQLESSGTEFLTGSVDAARNIAAGATETLAVPIRVPYLELYDVISGLEGGSRVPYKASFDLHVNAPVLGRISVPLQSSGDLPVPRF